MARYLFIQIENKTLLAIQRKKCGCEIRHFQFISARDHGHEHGTLTCTVIWISSAKWVMNRANQIIRLRKFASAEQFFGVILWKVPAVHLHEHLKSTRKMCWLHNHIHKLTHFMSRWFEITIWATVDWDVWCDYRHIRPKHPNWTVHADIVSARLHAFRHRLCTDFHTFICIYDACELWMCDGSLRMSLSNHWNVSGEIFNFVNTRQTFANLIICMHAFYIVNHTYDRVTELLHFMIMWKRISSPTDQSGFSIQSNHIFLVNESQRFRLYALITVTDITIFLWFTKRKFERYSRNWLWIRVHMQHFGLCLCRFPNNWWMVSVGNNICCCCYVRRKIWSWW